MICKVLREEETGLVFVVRLYGNERSNRWKAMVPPGTKFLLKEVFRTSLQERPYHQLISEGCLEETSSAPPACDRLSETYEQSQSVFCSPIVRCHGDPINVHRNREPDVTNADKITLRTNDDKLAIFDRSNITANHPSEVFGDATDPRSERSEPLTPAIQTRPEVRPAAAALILGGRRTCARSASSDFATRDTPEGRCISPRVDKDERVVPVSGRSSDSRLYEFGEESATWWIVAAIGNLDRRPLPPRCGVDPCSPSYCLEGRYRAVKRDGESLDT